ncbi:unnamed protein product [Didymodactylos carnosus]|uniref:Uncharacterized protein n=1 Tax=Didymodactylos carnosus TaxID=1234261 RepID=A0A814CZF8_9BILA|nr:unnamed protein product [Didymodactylos carnosus]CAF0949011.1 unnamed protein product [Didymodactylos carnosus]CAF3518079.1 unnamed protein product [Didymodactylos carnosus]CAF3724865.1 unnamed protein product [Didymodactylos carnosus]
MMMYNAIVIISIVVLFHINIVYNSTIHDARSNEETLQDHEHQISLIDQDDEDLYDMDKRLANMKFASGLGKRLANMKFASGLGKRLANMKFASGLGKRLANMKFASGLGKRLPSMKFASGLGKRNEYEDLMDFTDENENQFNRHYF